MRIEEQVVSLELAKDLKRDELKGRTEADARAKMLIYLKKEGLIQ